MASDTVERKTKDDGAGRGLMSLNVKNMRLKKKKLQLLFSHFFLLKAVFYHLPITEDVLLYLQNILTQRTIIRCPQSQVLCNTEDYVLIRSDFQQGTDLDIYFATS